MRFWFIGHIDGISLAYYYNSEGVSLFLMNLLFEEFAMKKMTQTGGPKKKARNQIVTTKKNARIGFLESMGNSGYDNRTDPNYCFDVLRNFMKREESDDETLG